MRTAEWRWWLGLVLALATTGGAAAPAAADFPPADRGYHNYAEVAAEAAKLERDYPALVRRFSIGKSWEGRDLWALKISDNVAVDEAEPEVLFDAGQHAREPLSVEMALYLLDELTGKYTSDARIRSAVDSREIWIVPNVNPDGSEYDISPGDGYLYWRKNRQGSGTDLNRNWGYQWGCCNGSTTNPAGETYRGAAPFSAPETAALHDFVLSRRVGGVQQIKTSIDFHTYGELVMWPFAYTYDDTAPGMTLDQREAFAALGRSMAQSNGFTPQQTSELYISDGNLRDWFWGSQGIFAYGFELWGGQGGFHPPDEAIVEQTSRNREAALQLVEAADCPYRPAGMEVKYCGATAPAPPPPPPVPPETTTPPPAVPPPPPPAGPGGDDGERATTAILATRAGLYVGGHIRLRVRCSTILATHCRGTAKLRARLPGGRAVVTIAKTNYAVAAGTARIELRLGPKARRALRRRTAITVTAIVTTWQESGGAEQSSSGRLELVRKRARAA